MTAEVEIVAMVFKIMRTAEHSQTLMFELLNQTILIHDSQIQELSFIVLVMHIHADLTVKHSSDRLNLCAWPHKEWVFLKG